VLEAKSFLTEKCNPDGKRSKTCATEQQPWSSLFEPKHSLQYKLEFHDFETTGVGKKRAEERNFDEKFPKYLIKTQKLIIISQFSEKHPKQLFSLRQQTFSRFKLSSGGSFHLHSRKREKVVDLAWE
jgi:hypothetical protein